MSTLEKIVFGIMWGTFTFFLGWMAGGSPIIGVVGTIGCTVVPLAILWDSM